LPILCVLLLCADLATAHGSFLVDGWKVWNNASISENARIEAGSVPVRVDLPSRQTLLIGTHSSIHLVDQRILVEKGCAKLDLSGAYVLEAAAKKGLEAGSDTAELLRASEIPRQYGTLRELRPMSQRP
jgi:hypothetical protein